MNRNGVISEAYPGGSYVPADPWGRRRGRGTASTWRGATLFWPMDGIAPVGYH